MDAFDPADGEDPLDALRKLLRDLGLPEDSDINDHEVRADLFRTMMQRLMPLNEQSDETIVWETARQAARHMVAQLGPDPSGSSRAARQVSDAVHLGELWLNEATSLPPLASTPVVWSRAEWIEATFPAWKAMLEPVIASLSAGLASAAQGFNLTELAGDQDLAQFQSVLQPIMSRAISAMFGAHVGEGLGKAATATLTGTDLGLPLLAKSYVAILPTNVAAIQQQAELNEEGLLVYCAIKETARQRLFTEVGWITPQIIALVQHYAHQMKVDPDALASAMENAAPDRLSPETMAAFHTDFSTILFSPEKTEEQQEILERTATLLSLVEGWVDDVTGQVVSRWLPDWPAISESLLRHRVTSTPAQIITPLIGLGTTPRAVRAATAFWEAVRLARGVDGRDDIWRHPEAMPGPADIADPAAFLAGAADAADPWDDELRAFLAEGETPDADGTP